MKPHALVPELLANRRLTPAELAAFIESQSAEGQYHDFKSGKLLDDKRKAARSLRRWITSFANADGGIFMIGVSEPETDGKRRVGGASSSPLQRRQPTRLQNAADYYRVSLDRNIRNIWK